MDWSREPWRKLYTRRDAEWLSMPLSARGLADELLKYTDDEGRIFIGSEPAGRALSRLLGAHAHEYRRVSSDVATLLLNGFVVSSEKYLRIRNYVEAQERRSSAAERMAKSRANRRTSDSVPPADVANTVTPVAATGCTDVRGIETKRNEEKRNDPSGGCAATPAQGFALTPKPETQKAKRETRPKPPPVPKDALPSDGWGEWRKAYVEKYESKYVSSPADGPTMIRLAEHARKEADSEEEALGLLTHWFAGYLADPGSDGFLNKQRHSLQFLPNAIPRYGAPGNDIRLVSARRPDPMDDPRNRGSSYVNDDQVEMGGR